MKGDGGGGHMGPAYGAALPRRDDLACGGPTEKWSKSYSKVVKKWSKSGQKWSKAGQKLVKSWSKSWSKIW